MGRTRAEQVEKMAAMLRNSSEADIEEMGQSSVRPWPSWPRNAPRAAPGGLSDRGPPSGRPATAPPGPERRRTEKSPPAGVLS